MKPELKMIKLADITPLMESDPARTKYFLNLIEKYRAVRNPLALGQTADNDYFLLDDSALWAAEKELELEYIPAQIIPFSTSLTVAGDIYVEGMNKSYLDDFCRLLPRAFMISAEDKSGAQYNNGIVLSVDIQDLPVMIISFKKSGGKEIPKAFFDFWAFLKARCRLSHKYYSDDNRSGNLKKKYNNCHIRAANLTLEEIRTAVKRYYTFPSCFLKFDFGPRIMGIDYPLNILNAGVHVDEKEKFLHELLNYRLNTGYSEYIKGDIYLLNY